MDRRGDVVMFDVDGGLADMSAFETILRTQPRPWAQFFKHAPHAAVVENGRHLVQETAALGYTVLYSTTRPCWVGAVTRAWLIEHDFPAGTLFTRTAREVTTQAKDVKLRHCRSVFGRLRRARLAAYVDDEAKIVSIMRAYGMPSRTFDSVTCTDGSNPWTTRQPLTRPGARPAT
jgi:hypothetical protein